jgi:hypothetical protein
MANHMNDLDDLEIEPLSDAALESVAGGKSSDGSSCCSCNNCSNTEPPKEELFHYA